MRAAALVFLLLAAACSGEAAAPPPLPAFADAGGERSCECLERGRCWTPEAAEGQGETRAFHCRRQGRTRALCRYESRFRPAEPAGAGWSSWSTTQLRFRHGGKGWCWSAEAG